MDIVQRFKNDFPILCIFLLFVFILYFIVSTAFKVARLYFVVSVNCWFCNKNTKVIYDKKNSFICPFCEQYNGFTEDGDYNCDLSDRYKERVQNFVYPSNQKERKKQSLFNSGFKNTLCETCNFNQALKVRSLADYSALSKNDDDIERFRNKLDVMYALCNDCEASLHQVLGIQDSWLKPKLLGWKIHKSRLMKNIPFKNGSRKLMGKLNQSLLSLSAAYLVVSNVIGRLVLSYPALSDNLSDPQILVRNLDKIEVAVAMGGLLLVFHHFFKAAIIHKKFQFQLCFFWSLLSASLAFSLQSDNLPSKDLLKYGSLALSLINFLAVAQFSKASPIKLKTRRLKTAGSPSSISSFSVTSPQLNSSVADFCDLKRSSSLTSVKSNVSTCSTTQEEDAFVEEVGIKGLTIGTPKKINPSLASSVFSCHSQSSSKSNKVRKENLIQPAKFCNSITQASWVAGGVWGGSPRKAQGSVPNQPLNGHIRNQERDLFSRSSSKSSGFISQPSDANERPSWSPCNSSYQDLSPPQSLSPSYRFVATAPSNLRSTSPVDLFDAKSGCSYQSFYTSSPVPSEREWSSLNSLHLPLSPGLTSTAATTTIRPSTFNWCNLLISFFLGFSLAANLFLCLIYWKSTVVV